MTILLAGQRMGLANHRVSTLARSINRPLTGTPPVLQLAGESLRARWSYQLSGLRAVGTFHPTHQRTDVLAPNRPAGAETALDLQRRHHTKTLTTALFQ